MDVIKVATNYCKDKVKEYPQLSDEINGFYSLFRMELEDDSTSWDNEWELLYSDVENLIEEYNTNKQ
jgi:hypothetical protein